MLDSVWSAKGGGYLLPLEVNGEWAFSSVEMPDVDGLSATDSGSSRQRLVNVTVEMKPGLVSLDVLHDRVRSHLESSSHDVVVQQRVVRRNVREEHVDGAKCV